MRKFVKEIIILVVQSAVFYLVPLFGMTDNPMGMVLLIVLLTLGLSLILGAVSKEKIKYLYPVIISVLFIPSVFIYYNETALVHAIWYLVVSLVGFRASLGLPLKDALRYFTFIFIQFYSLYRILLLYRHHHRFLSEKLRKLLPVEDL